MSVSDLNRVTYLDYERFREMERCALDPTYYFYKNHPELNWGIEKEDRVIKWSKSEIDFMEGKFLFLQRDFPSKEEIFEIAKGISAPPEEYFRIENWFARRRQREEKETNALKAH